MVIHIQCIRKVGIHPRNETCSDLKLAICKSVSKNWPLPIPWSSIISQTNYIYERGRDINMSEWVGCFCLQCIREKEVGVVEDLGE